MTKHGSQPLPLETGTFAIEQANLNGARPQTMEQHGDAGASGGAALNCTCAAHASSSVSQAQQLGAGSAHCAQPHAGQRALSTLVMACCIPSEMQSQHAMHHPFGLPSCYYSNVPSSAQLTNCYDSKALLKHQPVQPAF